MNNTYYHITTNENSIPEQYKESVIELIVGNDSIDTIESEDADDADGNFKLVYVCKKTVSTYIALPMYSVTIKVIPNLTKEDLVVFKLLDISLNKEDRPRYATAIENAIKFGISHTGAAIMEM